ncbi:hypothetical protein Hte_007384 [Hypoxylon texense]
MVCRTVRNFVRQNYPLDATKVSFTVTKLAMKAPKAVLVPASIIGSTLEGGLRMCPVLGSLDVTSMPVVGPFVAGVRAAQAAVNTLESAAAPLASVRAETEMPIGLIPIAAVGTNGRGPSVGKKQRMPLPDWF